MTSLSTVFDIVPLSEEEEEQVLSSVSYSKTRLAEDRELLRAWVAEQLHFPPSRITENDDFFTNFLIGSKGSIERCKKKLDGYYSWRRRSIIFADRNPASPSILDICKSVAFAMMPKCLPSGFRLSFGKFKARTTEYFDLLAFCRYAALLMDLRLRCGGISAGDTIVVDCANFSVAHLPSINPTVLRDMILFTQGSLAQRCDQYYLINCSSLAEIFINKIMKPCMNKKMAVRFTVSKESILLERFPREIVPTEYGGEGPSIESAQEKLTQLFRDLAKEGEGGLISRLSELTDESRRPNNSPLSVDESLFGVQGTIKSLTID